MPVCDACGRDHSDNCEIIEFSGQKFNVCGNCIPAVKEKPEDFLAGKKHLESDSTVFDVCRD